MNFRRLPSAESFATYNPLFQDAFPETAGTPLESPEHYAWKYGPGGKAAPSFEIIAGEEESQAGPLGYYAGLPLRHAVNGDVRTAVLVCDVMTHSAARGKGVFTKLGKYATDHMAAEGMDFCTGFPIRPAVIPGHLKVGWRIAFELPVYVRPVALQYATRDLPAGIVAHIGNLAFSAYDLALRSARPSAKSVEIRRGFDPGYMGFYAKWARQYPYHVIRDTSFIEWRLSAPQSEYVVLVARQANEVVGVAICRRSPLKHFFVLSVLDLMVLAGHPEALSALHRAIDREAHALQTVAVVYMCTRPDARRLRLTAHGYFISNIRFKLILKWLASNPEPSRFWDASAWHLGWLDTDVL